MSTRELPPSEAKRILDQYGKNQVIIWTHDARTNENTITCYGSDDRHSDIAHRRVLRMIEADNDTILEVLTEES